MPLVSFWREGGKERKGHLELISPAVVLNRCGIFDLFWESDSDQNYEPSSQENTLLCSIWCRELLAKQTLRLCFLLPRCAKGKAAVWGRFIGVLCCSQSVEEWGYYPDCGRLWARMYYSGWKWCSEIHLWVWCAVETPEQHSPGKWMDHQWHLIHQDPTSPQKGPEHSLLGTRPRPRIYRKAWFV